MARTEIRQQGTRSFWVVFGAVAITIASRLPLLDLPAWPDEGGFLTVAGGWHLGDFHSASLYGPYWVDRPPVLITLYGLADLLGGLVSLRLLGATAAAVTVIGVAWIARSVAGPRAAAWAALTAAALLSTPFHWSFMVDGELLAAPFVALGLALVTRGLTTEGTRGTLLSGAGGAMAVAALLTKQNMADVFVFMAALVTTGLLSRAFGLRVALRHTGAFAGGAVGFGAVIGVWTIAHGTSLGAVYYAMYPFRVDAATRTGGAISWNRLASMGAAAALSGLAVLTVWVVISGVRATRRDMHVLALLVVLGFDLLSVAVGTNYWLHYLIQPAVPVAALAGILAARGSLVRVWTIVAVMMALVGWTVLMVSPPQTGEELVGKAIAGAASRDDTILTIPGHPNVNYAAGLHVPYRYMWALPARTLDPGKVKLRTLLGGPRAPTWLVASHGVPRRASPGPVGAAIADHYHEVRRICGRVVYLHNDVQRASPLLQPRAAATRASRCESVTALPHLLREVSRTAWSSLRTFTTIGSQHDH
ncbi:MAG TPA: hypothetical protein VM688_01470 [Nocardioidaceae bacterium]|jgi:hypothetical protein|nr:hypothetical protein [Nocardioidaceae bacterium]